MKPSTQDLITYLEQNDLKYAQRADNEDMVMLGFSTRRVSLSLLFVCEERTVQLLCRLPFRAQRRELIEQIPLGRRGSGFGRKGFCLEAGFGHRF